MPWRDVTMSRLLLRALSRVLLAAPVMLALACTARADTLDEIQKRGKLVVGVKKDVPLWGQLDAAGSIVGLEPDLAADLGRRLGVQVELVGVLTADRIEAVDQRRVDLLIATLSDTPERRQRMTLVLPHYYASGANVLARRQSAFRQWADLRNRRVCGRRAAFYNRSITVTHGVDIVALYSNSLALAALRDGRCDAVLYDDTNIVAMLQDPSWARDFEMPLPTLHVAPWSIAIHKAEAGGRLEEAVSRAVADWHRSGTVLALERKWGIPISGYALQMNKIWIRRQGAAAGAPGGSWYCGELATLQSPRDCL